MVKIDFLYLSIVEQVRELPKLVESRLLGVQLLCKTAVGVARSECPLLVVDLRLNRCVALTRVYNLNLRIQKRRSTFSL